MKKDKKLIPKGLYCYTYIKGKKIVCPYWSIIKERPKQFNGYCSYLETGDLELSKKLNDEAGKIIKEIVFK